MDSVDPTVTDRQLPNVVADGSFAHVHSTNNDSSSLLDPSKESEYWSKGRILKNLFVVSFCYCLFLTGFWALTNLESTMNATKGMGPDSQAIIYGFSMLSSLFLPELTVDRFGCKKVLIFTTVLSLPYIAANIHLRWDSLIVSAALFGLSNGPFSAAYTVYIDEIALRFERQVTANVEFVMACFFGVYAFFMENTQVWGNAISSFVLKPEQRVPGMINLTLPEKCGINFEPEVNITNSNLIPPSEEEKYLLVGIFIVMGVLAALLMAIFLDPLKNDVKRDGCGAVAGRFVTSLKHYKTLHQILLIPLTITIGIESALYSNEFTEFKSSRFKERTTYKWWISLTESIGMISVIHKEKPSNAVVEEHIEKIPYPYKESTCLLNSPRRLEYMSRGRILKNMFVLSFCYCLFYTGFWALTNLQSTMNAHSNMGPYSQAVIYGFSMASSLFLPKLFINRFGCKKVLITCTFLCLPYIACNVYLRWDTLLASAALYGLASGPFSAALTFYINEIALRFQRTVTANVEFVMACFFGVYTFFMENTQVWGNVISFLVLKPDKNVLKKLDTSLKKCGIIFEITSNVLNSNLTPPTTEKRFLLIGVFVLMGLLALLIFGLFLDPLKNDVKREGCEAVGGRLVASLKHFVTFHQILLIPITIYIGIESALYSNEFTQI
ncbi:protein unc-93 homolog A [Nephila pilipes]|uniref:Protein unc-93 homolog A n=1 Tax=Nephila pilipes TaxID=299642 RepID=A0A8X6U504_NEPPI|nr:protein unc-93 homolog A [Nephila pilipes]